jgi:metal-sulfur cluster biosynthetic enzyme
MTLTTPGCPLGAYLDAAIHASLWGAPGVDDVDIEIVWDFPWTAESMNEAAKTALGWRQ